MYAPSESAREREVLLRHLEIKDSEIRISMLRQGMEAVDRGIHAGGAMSAVLPLVALYYGGFMRIDVKHPTETQDLFVLSKGHAVAAMASIYADLGYFDRKHLNRSRSRESILNGHPGPLLPGVHVPTGPMGQGICVAGGFALAGRGTGGFDVFTLTGDGELQEGSVWEAVMYSGAVGLDNLCVIVDRNHGQLDNPCDTVFPMREPGPQFSAFGYRVVEVTAGDYGPMVEALREFRNRVRDGRPTAIIVNGRKGDGAFGSDFIKHKLTLNRSAVETELLLQERRLQKRRAALGDCLTGLRDVEPEVSPSPVHGIVCRKAPERDKRIRFDDSALPRIEPGERYQACDVVAKVMKAAAVDPRLVAIDSDLGSTSGLYGGISAVDRTRAMNVGIAEANMMCIGEAYASLGYNAWVSTFCPFFNWNVLRRIAINQQERMESITDPEGWLSAGHTLDLTFLATASNFDTQTNGATHMGNDDILVFRETGHLKVIDVSCPVQLLEIMKWILEGGKGLVYLRIMRAASGTIHDDGFRFQYGKGYSVRQTLNPRAVIVSSGRGVHEAVAASDLLKGSGTDVDVIDMPSIDPDLICTIAEGSVPVLFAEQNNGFLWTSASRILLERGIHPGKGILNAVNTSGPEGTPRYIHSATYDELLDQFSLTPARLAERVNMLATENAHNNR